MSELKFLHTMWIPLFLEFKRIGLHLQFYFKTLLIHLINRSKFIIVWRRLILPKEIPLKPRLEKLALADQETGVPEDNVGPSEDHP